MQFAKESRISHPAKLVLDTMIERLEEVAAFMPSVESIERRSLERREDGTIHVVRIWQGTADAAPKAVRPFLSREALRWTDEAVWTPADHKVDWKISTSMSGLYTCGGTNYFEPHPEAPETDTRLRVTGALQVYPDKLPGVPGFLGKRLAPQIEKFVVNLLTPNVMQVATGLQGFLDDEQKKAG